MMTFDIHNSQHDKCKVHDASLHYFFATVSRGNSTFKPYGKRKKFDSGLDSMDPPTTSSLFFHIGFRRIECIQTFEVYNIYIHIHIHIH
jgi:hypothetical protein